MGEVPPARRSRCSAARRLGLRARATALRHPRQERRVLRRARLDARRHRLLRARRHVRACALAARGRGRRRARHATRCRRAPLRVPRLSRRGLRRAGAQAERRRQHVRSDRRLGCDRRRARRRGLACVPRAVVSDDPLRRVADLPRHLSLRFEGQGARVSEDGQRERCDGRVQHAGRLSALRRVPGQRPAPGEREHRCEALPELRATRADVDVVPQRDHPFGVHDRGRPGDPDGQSPGPRRDTRRAELPAQPLHAAREPLPDEGHGVADEAVPRADLPPPGAEHRDASHVALLGRANRLPAPRRAAVARGEAAGDRRVVGELRNRHRRRARGRGAAEGEPAHLLHRAPAGLQPLHRVVRSRRARRPRRRSTSCTC